MVSDNKTHEDYMRRCLQLAQCAEGLTYPNPLVGSVVVADDRIIGEGYHRKAGTPHAEVHAIASVRERNLLSKSTLYVNLEPCAHFGRTPPCARLIIESKIPRVVVGCVDSFSAVAGKGIEMMREAGIDVTVGVLESECRQINRRFFCFHEQKRPFVILKWAESADGFIGKNYAEGEQPIWLTGEQCRRMVHRQRTHEQAIMIGATTCLTDNPQLASRQWAGNNPLRILIDPHLRASANAKILSDGNPTIVLNAKQDYTVNNVSYVAVDFGSDSVQHILSKLYELGIQSVIVEGGSCTLQHFIDSGIWDEAYVYHSPMHLGSGTRAPQLKGDGGKVKHIFVESV